MTTTTTRIPRFQKKKGKGCFNSLPNDNWPRVDCWMVFASNTPPTRAAVTLLFECGYGKLTFGRLSQHQENRNTSRAQLQDLLLLWQQP
jgi:hypothetical protein